ncbi:Hint domain-containing protein [Acetobacter farinalis]|uniref:Hint domain-containing protein n=1 Tax=Acetobacter farinalis TaxID=1260984 RepID=UPI0035F259C0
MTVSSGGTYLVSGGGLTRGTTTIASGGTLNAASDGILSGWINNNGTLSGGLATSGSFLEVSSSGQSISTTIMGSGHEIVASGGTALATTVSGGWVEVRSGAFASGGSLTNGQTTVSAGGSATGVLVSGGGYLYDHGGVVSAITVTSAGTLGLDAGAQAYNVSLSTAGGVNIAGTGTVLHNLQQSGGFTSAYGGGEALSGSVQDGWLGVGSAGTASAVTAQGGGILVNANGSANALNIGSAGYDVVYAGGVTTSNVVNAAGVEHVQGGIASNTVLSSGANQYVTNGGTAAGASVQSGARQTVGTVSAKYWPNDTPWSTSGTTFAGNGAAATTTQVASGGELDVTSGGTVTSATVSGVENVLSGGVDNGSLIALGAVQNVYAGGYAPNGVVAGTENLWGTDSGSTVTSTGVLNVQSGGVASGETVYGHETIFSGGTGSGGTVLSGGMVTISGGTTNGLTVGASGILAVSAGSATGILVSGAAASAGTWTASSLISGATVLSGGYLGDGQGVLSAVTVGNGGTARVVAAGSAYNVTVSSGGTYLVSGGGLTRGTTTIASGGILNGATDGILSGTVTDAGLLSGGVVASGGVVNVVPGGSANTVTVGSSGMLTVVSATVANTTVQSGGSVTASSGSVLSGSTMVSAGGMVSMTSGATMGSGANIWLRDGGSATIWNNAGGTIVMDGSTNTGLVVSGLSNGGTLSTVISGFDGTSAGNSDGIELAGVTAADVKPNGVSYPDNNHVTLALTNGQTITMNIVGVGTYGYTLGTAGDGDLVFEVCFLAGSMIRTPSGDVAVEELRIGDTVMTWDWKAQTAAERPVVWAGRKSMQVKAGRADDEAGYPVRILKDALADGVPSQDLLVTPEHCLFFEDKFVPVRMLVNGRSIVYDRSITSYDYFHIETEEHAVIWANDTRTESYLDTGNRAVFSQDGSLVRLVPQGEPKSWETDGAARLTVERAMVEPLFAQFSARAVAAGMEMQKHPEPLTENPDIHLVTGAGQIIRPARHKNDLITFMLPSGLETVRIVSRASRPSDVIGPFVDDRRQLGVLVGQITLFDGNTHHKITEHLEQAELSGWNAKETAPCRWTNGNAILPLPERKTASLSMLTVQVVAAGPYLVHQDDETESSLKIAN